MSQAKTSQLVKTVAYSSNNSNQENEWSQTSTQQQQNRSIMNNSIVDQWSNNNHQLEEILFEPKVSNLTKTALLSSDHFIYF